MNFNYYADVSFSCREKNINRVVQLPFTAHMEKLAYLLFASLVKTEDLEKNTFIMKFDDDVFITRYDEQNNGFGYSYSSYRILETEKFLNVVLQNPRSSSFELLNEKYPNLVFTMELGNVRNIDDDQKLELLDGEGILSYDLSSLPYTKEEVLRLAKKNLPLVRKIYHMDRQ